MTRLVLGAPLVLIVLAGCDPQKPPAQTTPAQPQTKQPQQQAPQSAPVADTPPAQPAQPAVAGNVEEGKKVYLTMCATCHGPDGTGAMMRAMMPKIGDLTSAEMHARMKDADISTLVTNGRDKMPPFGAVIKPNQLNDLIAYVRSLKKG